MALSVRFVEGRFICKCSYRERKIPEKAGFRFSLEERLWYTPFPTVAARLREHASERARLEMDSVLLRVTPWSKPLTVPPGQTLLKFQPKPCNFVLSRNRSYLALDPGLGKTIVAAVCAATLGHKTVYICPTFLTRTVEEEFWKWAPKMKVLRLEAGTPICDTKVQRADVLIVPDSIINRDDVKDAVVFFCASTRRGTFGVIDEAHRYKNKKAARSKVILGSHRGQNATRYGLVDYFDRATFMSGTPMPNRPMELYFLLSRVAPECIDFMTEFDFGVKYCAGRRNGFGWDFSGSSNMADLARRLKHPHGPFMYRLSKKVLNLPPRIEEMLIVDKDMSKRLGKMNANILRKYSPTDLMKAAIAKKLGQYEGELHIATYRRLLALEKVPFTVEVVRDILENSNSKILLFAIHKEVIAKLEEELYEFRPLVIAGKINTKDRHKAVAKFQRRKKRRLMILNIVAGGVGLTLTKSNRVLFHESSWNPGENSQAIDRAHRHGQKFSVLAQHIVYRNSIDKGVLEQNFRKLGAIKHI